MGSLDGLADVDLTRDHRARRLADGNEIPLLGLGVWQVRSGGETENAVRWALEAGYRHIDTAQAYGNEESVGKAIRDSDVPREEIFVATKFYPGSRDPEVEAGQSLRRLGLEQVDLYLVHWPQCGPTWAWPGMERAQQRGLARSIGVSNFEAAELDALLAQAQVRPVVNQVQFSPFKYRRALLEACTARDIVLEAYSPLTTGRSLDDPRLAEIAERNGRTPAQVMLRWAVQRGIPVIPKSTRRERTDLRLQPVGRRHAGARRAGRDRRHGPRARTQMVALTLESPAGLMYSITFRTLRRS
jgi:diketogulonate reductase-like aldo/keto reductase